MAGNEGPEVLPVQLRKDDLGDDVRRRPFLKVRQTAKYFPDTPLGISHSVTGRDQDLKVVRMVPERRPAAAGPVPR